MRLIDADVFEKFIRKNCTDSLVDLWCELVRRQPTSYDVDKVVNQMEKDKFIDCETILSDVHQGYNAGLSRAIEIVKEGGNS